MTIIKKTVQEIGCGTPRSSSRTTLALRLADQRPLPPRSVSGPAPVALRAPSAGPEIEGLVLDIFHSLYRKSVSNEIVLREKVVTQRQLLVEVWGPQHSEQAQYLRVYMAQLRRKLETDPARPRYLRTEPGVGYRLVSE